MNKMLISIENNIILFIFINLLDTSYLYNDYNRFFFAIS